MEQAAEIGIGQDIESTIFDAAVEDWYQFELEEPAYVTLKMNHFPEYNGFTLDLYNDAQSRLASSTVWTVENLGDVHVELEPGTYSISVRANNPFPTHSYSFRVEAETIGGEEGDGT